MQFLRKMFQKRKPQPTIRLNPLLSDMLSMDILKDQIERHLRTRGFAPVDKTDSKELVSETIHLKFTPTNPNAFALMMGDLHQYLRTRGLHYDLHHELAKSCECAVNVKHLKDIYPVDGD